MYSNGLEISRFTDKSEDMETLALYLLKFQITTDSLIKPRMLIVRFCFEFIASHRIGIGASSSPSTSASSSNSRHPILSPCASSIQISQRRAKLVNGIGTGARAVVDFGFRILDILGATVKRRSDTKSRKSRVAKFN